MMTGPETGILRGVGVRGSPESEAGGGVESPEDGGSEGSSLTTRGGRVTSK